MVNGILHAIMHDMYEGVLLYEVKLLLRHCVQSKYFTLKVVHERLQSCDFKVNEPTLIDERVFNNDSVRQSASQMMALAFELPLIVGDMILVGDKNWEAFLLLLRICKIINSPRINHDAVVYVQQLIEEKLILFTQLYPNENLIPKQHCMIYYPSQILRVGLLLLVDHEA